MRSRDDQGAITDQITDGAEHEGLGGRVVGDAAAVLEVAREAEEDDAFDLRLDGRGEGLDRSVHDCCALTVCRGR